MQRISRMQANQSLTQLWCINNPPFVSFLPPAGTAESAKLTLLVVTADGRRIYFSTQYLRGGAPPGLPPSYAALNAEPPQPRPVTLQAIFARPALPQVRPCNRR